MEHGHSLVIPPHFDGNGFDDELFATEIAYLANNFRNFLRNNNRSARGKNNAEPRNFRNVFILTF